MEVDSMASGAPFPLTNKVTSKLGETDFVLKNGEETDVQTIVVEEEDVVFHILPNEIYLYSHPISTGREWHSNGPLSVNDEGKVEIELP